MAAQGTSESLAQLQAEIDEGRAVYAEKCGICHGADLEGKVRLTPTQAFAERLVPTLNSTGVGWRRSDSVLLAIIQHGERVMVFHASHYLMPAFRKRLTLADARRVLAFIKSAWTERQRRMQAEATATQEKLLEESR